jgi:type IV secretory pathway VirB2 component (pilin)
MRIFLLLSLFLLPGLAAPAHAAAGGSTLPFNEPLTLILDNLTGPTANVIIVVLILAGLVTVGLSRDQGWVKTLGGAVVIAALIAKSASLPGVLGLATATASETASPGPALLLAGGLFLVLAAPLILLRERRSPARPPAARA